MRPCQVHAGIAVSDAEQSVPVLRKKEDQDYRNATGKSNTRPSVSLTDVAKIEVCLCIIQVYLNLRRAVRRSKVQLIFNRARLVR
jgi:hypothetical protein